MIPMKLKDIPALLVSPPSLASGSAAARTLIGPPFLILSARPKCGHVFLL
jgi:hypothetical protein